MLKRLLLTSSALTAIFAGSAGSMNANAACVLVANVGTPDVVTCTGVSGPADFAAFSTPAFGLTFDLQAAAVVDGSTFSVNPLGGLLITDTWPVVFGSAAGATLNLGAQGLDINGDLAFAPVVTLPNATTTVTTTSLVGGPVSIVNAGAVTLSGTSDLNSIAGVTLTNQTGGTYTITGDPFFNMSSQGTGLVVTVVNLTAGTVVGSSTSTVTTALGSNVNLTNGGIFTNVADGGHFRLDSFGPTTLTNSGDMTNLHDIVLTSASTAPGGGISRTVFTLSTTDTTATTVTTTTTSNTTDAAPAAPGGFNASFDNQAGSDVVVVDGAGNLDIISELGNASLTNAATASIAADDIDVTAGSVLSSNTNNTVSTVLTTATGTTTTVDTGNTTTQTAVAGDASIDNTGDILADGTSVNITANGGGDATLDNGGTIQQNAGGAGETLVNVTAGDTTFDSTFNLDSTVVVVTGPPLVTTTDVTTLSTSHSQTTGGDATVNNTSTGTLDARVNVTGDNATFINAGLFTGSDVNVTAQGPSEVTTTDTTITHDVVGGTATADNTDIDNVDVTTRIAGDALLDTSGDFGTTVDPVGTIDVDGNSSAMVNNDGNMVFSFLNVDANGTRTLTETFTSDQIDETTTTVVGPVTTTIDTSMLLGSNFNTARSLSGLGAGDAGVTIGADGSVEDAVNINIDAGQVETASSSGISDRTDETVVVTVGAAATTTATDRTRVSGSSSGTERMGTGGDATFDNDGDVVVDTVNIRAHGGGDALLNNGGNMRENTDPSNPLANDILLDADVVIDPLFTTSSTTTVETDILFTDVLVPPPADSTETNVSSVTVTDTFFNEDLSIGGNAIATNMLGGVLASNLRIDGDQRAWFTNDGTHIGDVDIDAATFINRVTTTHTETGFATVDHGAGPITLSTFMDETETYTERRNYGGAAGLTSSGTMGSAAGPNGILAVNGEAGANVNITGGSAWFDAAGIDAEGSFEFTRNRVVTNSTATPEDVVTTTVGTGVTTVETVTSTGTHTSSQYTFDPFVINKADAALNVSTGASFSVDGSMSITADNSEFVGSFFSTSDDDTNDSTTTVVTDDTVVTATDETDHMVTTVNRTVTDDTTDQEHFFQRSTGGTATVDNDGTVDINGTLTVRGHSGASVTNTSLTTLDVVGDLIIDANDGVDRDFLFTSGRDETDVTVDETDTTVHTEDPGGPAEVVTTTVVTDNSRDFERTNTVDNSDVFTWIRANAELDNTGRTLVGDDIDMAANGTVTLTNGPDAVLDVFDDIFMDSNNESDSASTFVSSDRLEIDTTEMVTDITIVETGSGDTTTSTVTDRDTTTVDTESSTSTFTFATVTGDVMFTNNGNAVLGSSGSTFSNLLDMEAGGTASSTTDIDTTDRTTTVAFDETMTTDSTVPSSLTESTTVTGIMETIVHTEADTESGVAADTRFSNTGVITELDMIDMDAFGGGDVWFSNTGDMASEQPINSSPGNIFMDARHNLTESFDWTITDTLDSTSTLTMSDDPAVDDIETIDSTTSRTESSTTISNSVGGDGSFTNTSSLDFGAYVNVDGNVMGTNSGQMRGDLFLSSQFGSRTTTVVSDVRNDVFRTVENFDTPSFDFIAISNSGDRTVTTTTTAHMSTATGSNSDTGEIGGNFDVHGQASADMTSDGEVFGHANVSTSATDSTSETTTADSFVWQTATAPEVTTTSSSSTSTTTRVGGDATYIGGAISDVHGNIDVTAQDDAILTNAGRVGANATATAAATDSTSSSTSSTRTEVQDVNDPVAETDTNTVTFASTSTSASTSAASGGDATLTNTATGVIGYNGSVGQANSIFNATVVNDGIAHNLGASNSGTLSSSSSSSTVTNSLDETVTDANSGATISEHSTSDTTFTSASASQDSLGTATVTNNNTVGLFSIDPVDGDISVSGGDTNVFGGSTATVINAVGATHYDDIFASSLSGNSSSSTLDVTSMDRTLDVPTMMETTVTVDDNEFESNSNDVGGTTTVDNWGDVGAFFTDATPAGGTFDTNGGITAEGSTVLITNNLGATVNGRMTATGNSGTSSFMSQFDSTRTVIEDLDQGLIVSDHLVSRDWFSSSSMSGGNGDLLIVNDGLVEGGVTINGNGASSIEFLNNGQVGLASAFTSIVLSNIGSQSTSTRTIDRELTILQPSPANFSSVEVTTTVETDEDQLMLFGASHTNTNTIWSSLSVTGDPATATNTEGATITGSVTVDSLFFRTNIMDNTTKVETDTRTTAGINDGLETLIIHERWETAQGNLAWFDNRADATVGGNVDVEALNEGWFANGLNSIVSGSVSVRSRTTDRHFLSTPDSLTETITQVGGFAHAVNDGFIGNDVVVDGLAQSFFINNLIVGDNSFADIVRVGSTSPGSYTNSTNVDGLFTEELAGFTSPPPAGVIFMDVPTIEGVSARDSLNSSVFLNTATATVVGDVEIGSFRTSVFINDGIVDDVNMWSFEYIAPSGPETEIIGFREDEGGINVLINNNTVDNVSFFDGNSLLRTGVDTDTGIIRFESSSTFNTVDIGEWARTGGIFFDAEGQNNQVFIGSMAEVGGNIVGHQDEFFRDTTRTGITYNVNSSEVTFYHDRILHVAEMNKVGDGTLVMTRDTFTESLSQNQVWTHDIEDVNVREGALILADFELDEHGTLVPVRPFAGPLIDPERSVYIDGNMTLDAGTSVMGDFGLSGNLDSSGLLLPGILTPSDHFVPVSNLSGEGYATFEGGSIRVGGTFTQNASGSFMVFAAPSLVSDLTLGSVPVPEPGSPARFFLDSAPFEPVDMANNPSGMITAEDGITANGSVLVATSRNAIYENGQSYTILKTMGDLDISGLSVSAETDSPFINFSVSTGTEGAYSVATLTVSRTSYGTLSSGSANQMAIASGLDSAVSDVAGRIRANNFATVEDFSTAQDVARTIAALDYLYNTQATMTAALDSLDGQFLNSVNAIDPASGFMNVSQNRVAGRLGSYGGRRGPNGMGDNGRNVDGAFPEQGSMSLWAEPYLLSNNIDGDSSAGLVGIDSSSVGVGAGFDIMLTDNFLAGFGAGYTDININADSWADSADVKAYQMGFYFAGQIDMGNSDMILRLGLQGVYVWADYDVTRDLPVFARSAFSQYDANELQISGTAALDIDIETNNANDRFVVTPNVSVLYRDRSTDAFTETGAAGGLALTVAENNGDGVGVHVAVDVAYSVALNNGMSITPYGSVGFQSKTNPTEDLNVAFIGGGNSFNLQGVEPHNLFIPQAGVNMMVTDSVQLFIDYTGGFGGDQKIHKGTAGLRLKF